MVAQQQESQLRRDSDQPAFKSPTLEERAVQRVNATQLALDSVKLSAKNHRRSSHDACAPQSYQVAIQALQCQLDIDEAYLRNVRVVSR